MSLKDAEFIKQALTAIISGDTAPLKVKQFYTICLTLSVSSLSVRKYHFIVEEILSNLGYNSIRDLAYDCIYKLFRTENGRFVEIEKYFFKKFPEGLENVQAEIIKANLGLLIKSKTNQQLSGIRGEWGDTYFKIRKAVTTEISRKNSIYKKIVLSGKCYVAMNYNSECNLNLPQLDKDTFLTWLFDIKLKKYDVAKVMRELFNVLNSQSVYARVIEEKVMLDVIKEFYIARMNDFLLESVEYNINEVINETIINQAPDYDSFI